MSKNTDIFLPESFRSQYNTVSEMNDPQLEDLENAVYFRRLELMATRLGEAGFSCRVEDRARKFSFRYVLVQIADSPLPGQWATLQECQRLIDTARNLPIKEAFERWSAKVEPVPSEPYTRSQARQDVKEERDRLQEAYQNGEINSEDLRLGWTAARDYLDLAD